MNWSYLKKATSLRNARKVEESKALLDSLFSNLPSEGYDALKKECCKLYVAYYSRFSKQESKDSLWYYFRQIPQAERGTDLAQYYLWNEEYDSLENELSSLDTLKLDRYDSLFVDYYYAVMYMRIGQTEKAFGKLNSVLFRMDTLYHSYHTLGIESSQSDFFLSMAQEEERRANEERKQWQAGVLMLLAICVMTGIAGYEHVKRKNAEMERNMELIDQLRRQLTSLFQQQNGTLDELCNTYYMLTSKDDEKTKIYQRVQKILKSATIIQYTIKGRFMSR